jgi:hypothetical protein
VEELDAALARHTTKQAAVVEQQRASKERARTVGERRRQTDSSAAAQMARRLADMSTALSTSERGYQPAAPRAPMCCADL